MNKVSDHLQRAQRVSDDAIKKLHTGKGNLVTSVEKLKRLGAKAKKQLDKELLEVANANDEFNVLEGDASALSLEESHFDE